MDGKKRLVRFEEELQVLVVGRTMGMDGARNAVSNLDVKFGESVLCSRQVQNG